jgi:short subunit dehydrogenase-like uncharacterized protein
MGRKIVLFGATGYTGARTAEAMTRRGLRPVLAGRNRFRLAAIAERLGGLPTAWADATDQASVRALIDTDDVLVSTVGPFQRYGDPAVAASVDAGAIYFDSTGEPPFIRRVFEQHGPAAARSGAALLTAFGNDYVPGTLAGALALTEAGAATSGVRTGYFIAGGGAGQGFSRGTLRSLAGVLFEPMYSWRDGALAEEPTAAKYRSFQVAGKDRPATSIGAIEQFALPRLAATGVAPRLREVEVYQGWFVGASRAVHLSARGIRPLTRAVPVSRAITALAGKVVGRVAEEPSAATLARTTSYFVGEAYGPSGELATVTLIAGDPYGITAELLAWGAGHASEHGVTGAGALDAVSAFGLSTLREGAQQAGITSLSACPS